MDKHAITRFELAPYWQAEQAASRQRGALREYRDRWFCDEPTTDELAEAVDALKAYVAKRTKKNPGGSL